MLFCLFGSYGQNNFGDEAIADGIIRTLHSTHSDFKVVLFSHNPNESSNLHPKCADIRPMIASGIRSFLQQKENGDWQKNKKIIKNADWIIIGGGGIFHDKEIGQSGTNPLFIWWLRSMYFKYLHKKIIIWGVGVGPLGKPVSKFFLKGILKRADIITVRDQASFDLIKKITNKEIHSIPDPVWGLFEATNNTCQKKILGINIRESYRLSSKQLIPKLITYIQDLSKQISFEEIWLIPFALGKPDDRDLMSKIIPELHKHFPISITIKTPNSPLAAFSLVSSCIHFIAMRFHSYIFAVSANIPCTLLSYSSKTDEITKHDKQYYLQKQKSSISFWRKYLS